MTVDIFLVFAILGVSLFFFITETLPMDLVALLVLGALAVSGLVTPEEALSGFGNSAVVTVWAMFILSEGLTRTGIADIIGKQVLKFAGDTEFGVVMAVMLTAAGLSAFMSNIGVAALLLPVVMDIAAKTKTAPSRLLMPLAFGTLLGGLTTLIGTPPNLLVSNALEQAGHKPFALFDYLPVGMAVTIAGVLFLGYFSKRILPHGDTPGMKIKQGNLLEQYDLATRTKVMRIPSPSRLDGLTLEQIRFGSALGLSVLAISRGDRVVAGPGPRTRLKSNDLLLVQGVMGHFDEARRWREWFSEPEEADPALITNKFVGVMEFMAPEDSSLVGDNLLHADLRNRFGVLILAMKKRDGTRYRSRFSNRIVEAGDRLVLKGRREDLEDLCDRAILQVIPHDDEHQMMQQYNLEERLFKVHIGPSSPLAGKTLAESRLGDAFAFNVMGFIHDHEVRLMLDADMRIEAGDCLLIQGAPEYAEVMTALGELELEKEEELKVHQLDTRKAGFIEVVLTPRSQLAGKTPRELGFMERYDLRILGIWRQGEIILTDLRNQTLLFGDAILLFGRRKHLQQLQDHPDFISLSAGSSPTGKKHKAPVAALIMALVILPVLFGWISIVISALLGVTLMVITGCLTMAESYQAIEWRSIFLISGMLPLGAAMGDSGAANLMADGVMTLLGGLGPWPVIMGLYLITALATTIIPTPALVVMMAPVTISACMEMGVSPHTGMMAMAIAASASFTSPIAHPSNTLVMGPGGYRFKDYLRLGTPLAIIVMIITFLILPLAWPL